MSSDLTSIENRLDIFLDRFGHTVETIQFRRVYLSLLLRFTDELDPVQLRGALELKEYFSGKRYDAAAINKLTTSCNASLDEGIKTDSLMTGGALLNTLLLGALLESDETDFFYITEPLFLFARKMNVAAADLEKVLVSEFCELQKI